VTVLAIVAVPTLVEATFSDAEVSSRPATTGILPMLASKDAVFLVTS
jgi:hypothetical protein